MVDLSQYYVPPVDYPEEYLQSGPAEIDGEMIRQGTEEFFQPDGPLKHAELFGGRPYEFRSQQLVMAQKVADALAEGKNLCVEAPTGIGKSFAYLIPALIYARQSPHPVVVSTETINLQEQLIEKDLPFLAQITQLEFRTALAKGRSNYLCLRRLGMLSGDQKDKILPRPSLLLDLEKLQKWASKTADGNRDGFDSANRDDLWSYVCCEGGNCRGKNCAYFNKCFYWRARREWEDADIIVANHALFLTDLKLRGDEGGGLLPAYSAVVIDEAHTLENSAADHLGLLVAQGNMTIFFNRLFNPDNARGLLVRGGEDALELRREITEIRQKITLFFQQIQEYIRPAKESTVRIHQPNLFPDTLSPAISRFRQHLADYVEIQEDKDFKAELASRISWCDDFIDGLSAFLQMGLPGHVYWIDRERNDNLSLHAAPLNVAEILKEVLFLPAFPVVLSSATLTVGGSFDYYRSRVGFCGGEEIQLSSPFRPEQVKLYLAGSMPEPGTEAYEAQLNNAIAHFIQQSGGKAFVLFTSYSQLYRSAEALKAFCYDCGFQLLVQGSGMSRSALLREFKSDITSVLFGADSFWTGVDVPGEALSNVIITKLPFPVPSEPLVAARCEVLERAGKSPFMDYCLPEAVLKFRQGIGRLIRSGSDRGIVVILDRRIVSKQYGKIFRASLPAYPEEWV